MVKGYEQTNRKIIATLTKKCPKIFRALNDARAEFDVSSTRMAIEYIIDHRREIFWKSEIPMNEVIKYLNEEYLDSALEGKKRNHVKIVGVEKLSEEEVGNREYAGFKRLPKMNSSRRGINKNYKNKKD
ncbi:MAG: hypothetical protein AABX30_02575 [Nanoarchaeota archaeon]